MHTSESLFDIHHRTQRSLDALFAHLADLEPNSLERSFDGFGYPTLRLQLHHMIGAEHYWITLLEGEFVVTGDDAYPDLASLDVYRTEVAGRVRAWLADATPEILNEPKAMMTWGGREKTLVPAAVVMRTQTHHFAHLGQILAMLRLLGHPARGLDYPLN
jgi:uncharacterized damage-inducible protein DinB